MALAPKLELRQGQQLVMTPQLQQAIRLLQLSNVELCTFVEAELERNPLLERDEVAPEPSPETQAARATTSDGDEARRSDDWVAGEDPSARQRRPRARRARRAARRKPTAPSPSRRLGLAAAAHQQRVRRRGHQPRGLRRGRPVAGGPPDRAAARRRHRSRRAADRRPPHPHGGRGRLSAGRPRRPRRQARCAGRADREGAGRAAGLRSARRVRARPRRVPGAAAQGPEPLRSADRQAARQPGAARRPQPGGPEARGRRRCRGARRHDRRDQAAQPEARPASSAPCRSSPCCPT